MLEFIAAIYNEEHEIDDLIEHVEQYVDRIIIVDDESTDATPNIMQYWVRHNPTVTYKVIPHTGLPETVKAEALKLVKDGSWVLMLDADERFTEGVLETIHDFLNSPQAEETDYVYFRQLEVIDGQVVREFQKSKLFRKEAIQFPLENIHADDVLTGRGLSIDDWIVLHRKSTNKQITREMEYQDNPHIRIQLLDRQHNISVRLVL